MKRSKSSRAWLAEHHSDPFVEKARLAGYVSRAAFKLLEINQKDKILRPGMMVVDLGAAPGGWCQVAKQVVGESGRVFGLDLLPLGKENMGVEFIQGDFTEQAVLDELNQLCDQPLDVVLSDMAPNFSGIAVSDQAKSMYLTELALDFAVHHLKQRGTFLVKCFQGADFESFLRDCRQQFTSVVIRKPEASRARSRELYLLAKGFKK